LNKFEKIARGRRVSNPVPGSTGPTVKVASGIVEARRTWSAKVLSDAAVSEFELEVPEDAM